MKKLMSGQGRRRFRNQLKSGQGKLTYIGRVHESGHFGDVYQDRFGWFYAKIYGRFKGGAFDSAQGAKRYIIDYFDPMVDNSSEW